MSEKMKLNRSKYNEVPGVTFYMIQGGPYLGADRGGADFFRFCEVEEALQNDGIATEWRVTTYHGYEGTVLAFDVYAHGNVVAPYLRLLRSASTGME